MNVPDILIVDEVLSVGDHNSGKTARMKTILDSGTTLLFVSFH